MALAVITINNPAPALDRKHQEVQIIHRALELAAIQMRGVGGVNASGTVVDAGITLGTWTYTAVGT